jgi:hypothetical protein
MNSYGNMTTKQIAANYKDAFAAHHSLAQAYAEGRAAAQDLRNSSKNLKAMRAAYAAEQEANQVRKH